MAKLPVSSIAVALEIKIAFFMSIFLIIPFRETGGFVRHEHRSNSQLSLNFVRTAENCRKLYQASGAVHLDDRNAAKLRRIVSRALTSIFLSTGIQIIFMGERHRESCGKNTLCPYCRIVIQKRVSLPIR